MPYYTPVLRFHAYFEHVQDRSVLTMPRQEWLNLWTHSGSAVQLDVTRTPMNMVAQSASVIAAVAVRWATSVNEIHIYRYDPADEPTPVNLDKYSVWEDLTAHQEFPHMVAAASAQNSPELQAYLRDNVFIVKATPGGDHWLPSVPASALAVMKHT
jgi:hypothetical protein